MTTPITPATGASFPVSVPLPIDGEAASSLSLRGFVQPFEDGMGAALALLKGGGVNRRCYLTSSTNLIVQPLGAIITTVGGVWTTLAHASPSTLNPSVLSGGLAASTRYWVYASNVANVITWTVSTTAPDVGLRYSSATTDLMYVSSFITNGGSAAIRYSQSDNEFVYFDAPPSGGGVTGTLFLDTAAMVGSTTVPYGYLVPTGAVAAKLYAQLTGGAGPLVAQVAGTGIGNFITLTAAAGVIGGYVEMSTTLGNTVDYTLSAGTGQFSIWCRGFSY